MKRLLFLLLPFTVKAQEKFDTISIRRFDTVRASLLLTRDKMQIAHHYEGYVVLNEARNPIAFLDSRQRRFKVEAIIWHYRLRTKKQ